jgi:hypothetical protein
MRADLKILAVTIFIACGVWFYLHRGGTVHEAAVPVEMREAASAKVAQPQQSLSSTSSFHSQEETPYGSDRVGQTLKRLFDATDAGQTDKTALNKILSELDQDPAFAQRMIEDGLARVPAGNENGIKRAGLLDLSLRFRSKNEDWTKRILTNELVSVPAESRISREEAKTTEERNAALTVTPDILRVRLAFSDMLEVYGGDCESIFGVTTNTLRIQTDELLKENIAMLYKNACPNGPAFRND